MLGLMAGLCCCASLGGILFQSRGLAAKSGSPWILKAPNLHFSSGVVNALKTVYKFGPQLSFYFMFDLSYLCKQQLKKITYNLLSASSNPLKGTGWM